MQSLQRFLRPSVQYLSGTYSVASFSCWQRTHTLEATTGTGTCSAWVHTPRI